MVELNSLFILIAQDAPNPGAPGADPLGGGNALLAFLPWIMIGVLFYFMMIRPQQRKAKEAQTMLANLKKNDRVVTTGGIYGTIVNAPKDSGDVTVKVDESTNTRIRVQRNSISRVITADTPSEETES